MPRPFGQPCTAALHGIVPQSGEAAAKDLTADLKLTRYPRSLRVSLPLCREHQCRKKGPAYAGPSLLKRVVLFMGTS
jgi:hypothetical protein